MKPSLRSTLSSNVPASKVIDWMDHSSFDDLYEVDIPNDHYVNIFHVEGKYHVPLFDSSYRELFDYALEYMIHPDDRDAFESHMNPGDVLQRLEASEVPGMLVEQVRFKLQDGTWRWVEHYAFGGSQYGISDGVVRCYLFDIQNQKDREAGKSTGGSFETEGRREEKTRLLQEKGFLDQARELVNEGDAIQRCVVAIDLEHFRLFNDWYGREAGDMLLARIGEQLVLVEEKLGGVAGYMGQDDFFVVMPYGHKAVIELHDKLSDLVEKQTSAIGFGVSFGVAIIDEDIPLLDFIDRAKVALKVAKSDLNKEICLFNQDMAERANKEYETLLAFKQGIREREFEVYVQPQCRVSSGGIVGIEALARWRKPDGELVSPADFIPVLEKHGFITDLDLYIWDEVCRNLSNWLKSGHEAVPLSVNVSQADIFAIDVPECLGQIIEKYGIPPELLKVEITESAFANSSLAVEDVVRRLHDKGFVVLMDDFGSGYSSLNMLSSLNVDVIKLDAAFLQMNDARNHKSIQIVESIINMAKTMGLPIIAEGVETKEQVEFLDSLGCRYIQGFYYYRPMPLVDFEALIDGGKKIDSRGFVAKLNEQVRIREFLDQNVYSDAMLNSVLGAVAFYLWHDDCHVDIVRFNEQFYEAVGVPNFEDRLVDIQQFVPDDERNNFFDLLNRAMQDELNGATETVSFLKPDGTYARFLLHCYYVGESSEGKRFYTSARDVTALFESQAQMSVLSDYLSSSIVFMSSKTRPWGFKVVVHGLQKKLGLSKEQMQAELEDGRFYERIRSTRLDELKASVFECVRRGLDFTCPFELETDAGEVVPLQLRADHAKKAHGGIAYILTISEFHDTALFEKMRQMAGEQ